MGIPSLSCPLGKEKNDDKPWKMEVQFGAPNFELQITVVDGKIPSGTYKTKVIRQGLGEMNSGAHHGFRSRIVFQLWGKSNNQMEIGSVINICSPVAVFLAVPCIEGL